MEEKFKPKTEYNGDLFLLYLTYIHRYHLYYFHVRQAAALLNILQEDSWSKIDSWHDIEVLSSRYKLMHPNGRNTGCAVKKIGSMLVELGVLPPRDEDFSSCIAAKIAKFDPSIRNDIEDIVEWLEQNRRRPATVFMNLCYLLDYYTWLTCVYPASNPLKVTESRIVEHLRYLEGRGVKIDGRKASFLCLRRFFARLCYRKIITDNPCRLIEMPRLLNKINILSQDDFQSLSRYIQDISSPPTEALTILLMLFWGLKTNDVVGATLQITSEFDFEIILKRIPRSYGRHFIIVSKS